MNLKRGNDKFKLLLKKVRKNKKTILALKVINPVLMLLFIVVSFLTLYNNNIEEIYRSYSTLFIISMIALFLLIAFFDFITLKKKRENRLLNIKIIKMLNF